MRFVFAPAAWPAVLLASLMLTPASSADPAAASARAAAPSPSAEKPAAIFVVRHAEKEAGEDPGLTDAGRRRADLLTRTLRDAGVDAVYATRWRRTRETAAPIAAALDLDVRAVDTAEGFEQRLAAQILADHPGEVVLVVGHSHTNPALLRALGAVDAPDISERDYDDLYVVIFPGGEPRLMHLGYGRPTP